MLQYGGFTVEILVKQRDFAQIYIFKYNNQF